MRAYFLWIAVFCYSAHFFEEVMLDWLFWAKKTLKLKTINWKDFYIANTVVLILGICGAMVGWQNPSFSLILPALMLINGIFFHILPTIIKKRYSPGLFTAIILFLPIGILCFYAAYFDKILTLLHGVLSFIFAIIIMSLPFIFLRFKTHIDKAKIKK